MLFVVSEAHVRDTDRDHSLVGSIIEKNECNDRVCCCRLFMLPELRKSNGLSGEKDNHGSSRDDEEQTSPESVHSERGTGSPDKVPNLKRASYGQLEVLSVNTPLFDLATSHLGSGVCNANKSENLVQVERDQSVAGPLRKESDGHDEAHPFPVRIR
jgi:hypothetical protein